MKQGRKKNSAYELYGFIPRVDSGKHSAICTSCNRVLKNTAATRLQRHRNSCLAGRAGETLPLSPAIENERRKKQNKIDAAQELQHQYQQHHEMESEHESNSNVKIEQSNEITYAETSLDYNPSRKSTTNKANRHDDKLKAKMKYFKEKSKYFLSELNNLKVEKTMMVLESKKLRMEIERLRAN